MKSLLIGFERDRGEGLVVALAEHGHAASVATSTGEALTLLEASPGSLLVLHQRPGFDASGACRVLRAAPGAATSIILVMVAGSDAALIEPLLDSGADDFFFDTPGDIAFRARLRVVDRVTTLHRKTTDDVDVLFDLAVDLSCIAHMDGRFRRVSPSWTTALGWSADELCSRPWLDFVHPDDQEKTIAAGLQLTTGANVIGFANRYRTRDGGYRLLEWRLVPSVDRGLIYASARDVTVERVQQEAMRDLAENLSTTLSSIGDGVLSVDVHGAIVRLNPVAEKLTGWTERAARGRPVVEVFRIVHAHARETVLDPVTTALRENRIVSLAKDAVLVRRDGTAVPIADSCAPIRSASGSVNGAVVVFRDITAERAAKEAHDQVQRQLVFSDRMASVSTLAAGIAHEINNPLSYITANLELVSEELQEMKGGSSSARMQELEDMLADACKGAYRIKTIVRGLKTLSRAEEERRTVVSVKDVLELAISMAFSEIKHRARLVKDYGEAPSVDADEARLGQVFINLLVNAAHSIPPGSMEDNQIRIVTSTDPTGRAVIEIHDTGAGIPANLMERIFDPLFTTKPVGIGTGLGLSICHSIIAGMGGEITVQSSVGKGSQFKVVLPAARPTSSSEPLQAPASPSARIPVIKQASVLIVDDEQSVGTMLSRVLRDHDVTTHTKAREALELICSGKHFDVILSDLMMPEMSGVEFYMQLAARCPEAAERVVFISGAFTAATEDFLSSIPNERLEKPFDASAVRALVQRFVK